MSVLVGGGGSHGERGRYSHGSRGGGGRHAPRLADIHVRGDIPDDGVNVDTGDGHKFNALHGQRTLQILADRQRGIFDIPHSLKDVVVVASCGLQPAGGEVGAVGFEVSPQTADEGLPLVSDSQVLVEGCRRGQRAGLEEVKDVGGAGGHLD